MISEILIITCILGCFRNFLILDWLGSKVEVSFRGRCPGKMSPNLCDFMHLIWGFGFTLTWTIIVQSFCTICIFILQLIDWRKQKGNEGDHKSFLNVSAVKVIHTTITLSCSCLALMLYSKWHTQCYQSCIIVSACISRGNIFLRNCGLIWIICSSLLENTQMLTLDWKKVYTSGVCSISEHDHFF